MRDLVMLKIKQSKRYIYFCEVYGSEYSFDKWKDEQLLEYLIEIRT